MASNKFESVEGYLTSLPEEVRDKLLELKKYILEAVPGAVQMMNYNIPAFALIEGGKRDQQIMISGFKKHLGFYPHPTTIEKFSDELKVFKSGKGSVQFPLNKPLPKDLILRMVKYRKELIDKEQSK